MKKLVAACIILAFVTACNDNSTKETTSSNPNTGTEQSNREKEISDSTKMLDKKLRDSNSTYSPDSLK